MKLLMKRTLSIWSVIVLSLCGILALAETRDTSPVIHDIRLGVDGKGQTRLVLDMDAEPNYTVMPISGHGHQLRIEVDQGAYALKNGLPKSKGHVGEVHLDGQVMTVDLTESALPVRMFVLEPAGKISYHRLVVDLEGASATAFAKAATPASSLKAPAEVAKEEPRKPETDTTDQVLADLEKELAVVTPPIPNLKPVIPDPVVASNTTRPRIVIDPGHGGHDPGALGSSGLKEKAVTLSAAQTLAKTLRARGYTVILTRDEDEFIDLEERIDIARHQHADLFLSLHADANPVPSARGASVYTLSESRSKKMESDVRSNGNFRVFDVELSQRDGDVGSILFDLANTDTKNESSRLASALIDEMKGEVPMVNNTHRQAGLVVLLSPDVPAVLVEMAFLSNAKDELNLGSPRWRKTITNAIADGIDVYFAGSPSRLTSTASSSAASVAGAQ